MQLSSVVLCNFRSYRHETIIPIDENLTALIGRNEAGKSTVLEALEIFFNNSQIKIEPSDVSAGAESKLVTIGCVFSDLPSSLVLDETAVTNLADEYLLRCDGLLEIRKEFDCSGGKAKENVAAIARHPVDEPYGDLLSLKLLELKRRLRDVRADANQTSNVAMRRAIWDTMVVQPTADVRLPLDGQEGKAIWDELKKSLPVYALFRSDRPSSDEDSEVQDPMRIAIGEALKAVAPELENIKRKVQEEACAVATRTLEKLQEMDPQLASELRPRFKAEPKWDTCFKLSLTSDDQIPLNKRGSGVRRLVLLNFFRAEAERRQLSTHSPGVIYAIEEPETAQHPANQRMIVEALQDLGSQTNRQILLTTHVPGLAGLLPTRSLRFIDRSADGQREIRSGDDAVYNKIAEELGVYPDNSVKLFICVEGPTDVSLLKQLSRVCREQDDSLPDLASDERVAFLPLGGSTLKSFVTQHYLEGFGRPEFHVYDSDLGSERPHEYEQACNQVNNRSDGSFAVETTKRTMENYLHEDAIFEGCQVRVTITDEADVSAVIQAAGVRKREAKRLLSTAAAECMNYRRLAERDPDGEVLGWMKKLQSMLSEENLLAGVGAQ